MPASQHECPACFTATNHPTKPPWGENHILSLPHPTQRRGTTKERKIEHRAQKSSSSPHVRDWRLTLRGNVHAYLSAVRRPPGRPSSRSGLWTISAGCWLRWEQRGKERDLYQAPWHLWSTLPLLSPARLAPQHVPRPHWPTLAGPFHWWQADIGMGKVQEEEKGQKHISGNLRKEAASEREEKEAPERVQ